MQAFVRIDEQKTASMPAAGENVLPDPTRLEHETSALRRLLGSGPFDEDSQFAKMLKSVLTPEQQARYAERSLTARESKKTIAVLNAADLESTLALHALVSGLPRGAGAAGAAAGPNF